MKSTYCRSARWPSPRMMFTFFNSCQLLHLDDMLLLIICTKGMKWGCFCSLNFDISLLLCVCFHSFDTVLFTEVCVHVQMHNLYWSYQRYGFVNISYFRKKYLKDDVVVAMASVRTWLEAGPEDRLLCQHSVPRYMLRSMPDFEREGEYMPNCSSAPTCSVCCMITC